MYWMLPQSMLYFLSINITMYIEKEKEDTRSEKDLLIRRLDNIFEWIENNKDRCIKKSFIKK